MLVVVDGRFTEDADSSGDEQKNGWSDEEEDAGDDDRMDEDDDQEEDDDDDDDDGAETGTGQAGRNRAAVQPAIPVTPRKRGRPRLSSISRPQPTSGSRKTTTKAMKTPTRTPNRTPNRTPDPSSARSSPGPTPQSRSVRSTRNLQPMYHTKIHPLDALDDEPAPPGQVPRRPISDTSSSDDDDMRMGRTPSGRGIKRKSRNRSRSRMRPIKGKVRDEDAYMDMMEVEKETKQPMEMEEGGDYSDRSIG
jgi:hypothetical protein